MRLLMGILLLSSALVVGHSRYLDAKTSDPQTLVPFNAGSHERGGTDWSVITVELAPGMINSWNSQPRGEFLYVLEGAGRLEVEGKRAIPLNPGSVSTLTSVPHPVLKNTSRTKTLKILVVFLNETSEPHPLLASGLIQGHQNIRGTAPNGTGKSPQGPHKAEDIGLVF